MLGVVVGEQPVADMTPKVLDAGVVKRADRRVLDGADQPLGLTIGPGMCPRKRGDHHNGFMSFVVLVAALDWAQVDADGPSVGRLSRSARSRLSRGEPADRSA